jgi:hypothetical protein
MKESGTIQILPTSGSTWIAKILVDFNVWAKEAGFNVTSIMPLTRSSSAAIAIK